MSTTFGDLIIEKSPSLTNDGSSLAPPLAEQILGYDVGSKVNDFINNPENIKLTFELGVVLLLAIIVIRFLFRIF
jgi:hypothetical protein